jgi:hypothetical protein
MLRTEPKVAMRQASPEGAGADADGIDFQRMGVAADVQFATPDPDDGPEFAVRGDDAVADIKSLHGEFAALGEDARSRAKTGRVRDNRGRVRDRKRIGGTCIRDREGRRSPGRAGRGCEDQPVERGGDLQRRAGHGKHPRARID